MKTYRIALAIAALSAAACVYSAENVSLFLKLNGAEVKGESTQTSLGRAGSIECVEFDMSGSSPRDLATGLPSGKRVYKPIRFVKRLDSSSPLLLNAMVTNQVGEAVFKFFRPNPTGDGTTQQFYTVTLTGVHISSVRQYVASTITPATSTQPPLEEVEITFASIKEESNTGKTTVTDDWRAGGL